MTTGSCLCGSVRYGLLDTPLITHCCHCRECQHLSGSAFAVNVLIERSNLQVDTACVTAFDIPPARGQGQTGFRCSRCCTVLWSCYRAMGPEIAFLRAGTLENCATIEPDVHIYCASKLPWVELPTDAQCFEAYYDYRRVWNAQSLHRLRTTLTD